MRPIFSLLPAAIFLSGCIDQSFFVKQNVTYDRYERDYIGCATTATQNVPTNTQVGWAPYVGIYSADTNSALRLKNFELCMRDKGYQQRSLPYCQNEKAQLARDLMNAPRDRTRRMKITSQSCYITQTNGQPFLYSG